MTENELQLNDLPEDVTVDHIIPEPCFVAKTALTAELQLEATKAAQTKLSRALTWACTGILAVLLGFTIWQYVLTPSSGNLLFLVVEVLLGAYIIYTQFFGQKRALKKWERQIQSQYGVNALHLTCEFYELTFVQTVAETGNDMDCGYSSIERIEETEHSYLLRCGKSRWFFVEKSGVEGDLTAFRDFLREKCGC